VEIQFEIYGSGNKHSECIMFNCQLLHYRRERMQYDICIILSKTYGFYNNNNNNNNVNVDLKYTTH
jgi:hypothetical protein